MNKLKYILSGLLSLAILIPLQAKDDPVRIEIKAKKLKEKKIFLCSYYDGQVYKQDSLHLSSKGTGVFRKGEKYPEGEYLIYIMMDTIKLNDKYFNFLLSDEQTFSITIDTSDLVSKTQISGAKQTEALLAYMKFLQIKTKEQNKLFSDFQALPESKRDSGKIESQINMINKDVQGYKENLYNNFEGKWVASFLRGVEPVTTDSFPKSATIEEYKKNFQYQKNHFFDNIDLQDQRFWRTSYFPKMVIDYMETNVGTNLDSLANAASQLVAKTVGDSICFQLMFNKLMNYSLSNKIMGRENIWMKLVEDYYHKGLITWSDSARMEAIETEYKWLQNNRIGQTAHDLDLQDIDGNPVKLYNIGKKYTLLYFYEPSCGHCVESTPKLYGQIHNKYTGKGLDIVALCISQDKKEWTDFIEKNNLKGSNWHNVCDPPSTTSYFWQYYDMRSSPSIYIIDENKKIIAKKIDIETADILLDSILNN